MRGAGGEEAEPPVLKLKVVVTQLSALESHSSPRARSQETLKRLLFGFPRFQFHGVCYCHVYSCCAFFGFNGGSVL